MALWNGWVDGTQKKFVNLKLISITWPVKDKAKQWPKFHIMWKDFKDTWETVTQVIGTLTKITSSFTPKNGAIWDVYGFKAYLEDGDEIYVIESTINNGSKGWLNKLLKNKGVKMKITAFVNDRMYPDISVKTMDNEHVEQHIPFPKIVTIEEVYAGINKYFPVEIKEEDKKKEEWGLSVDDSPFG